MSRVNEHCLETPLNLAMELLLAIERKISLDNYLKAHNSSDIFSLIAVYFGKRLVIIFVCNGEYKFKFKGSQN